MPRLPASRREPFAMQCERKGPLDADRVAEHVTQSGVSCHDYLETHDQEVPQHHRRATS